MFRRLTDQGRFKLLPLLNRFLRDSLCAHRWLPPIVSTSPLCLAAVLWASCGHSVLQRLLPHSWHWWLWSSVVPVCQGLVIRPKSSFMKEARTGLVILLFSVYLYICLCLMVLCCFLWVRKNSPPPCITYCAFCFAYHPSHVVCRLSWLFAVPSAYVTPCLAIFVSSMPPTCNSTHLW